MRRYVKLLLAVLCLVSAGAPVRAFVVGTRPGDDAPGAACIVVIDPGHGGEDSGAVGPGGVEEKTITLNVAKRLADDVREKTGCVVLLTREDDTYVPLSERTAFANSRGADVFISIHVNAARSRTANGVETYFLSFDATDDDALRVAQFENGVVRVDGETYGEAADDLNAILMDMVITESHHRSSRLAGLIQPAVLAATGEENRGVKQAPFMVLNGAAMPAVLVELGFISNPKSEKDLSSADMQARIAASLADAIARFNGGQKAGKDYIGLSSRSRKD